MASKAKPAKQRNLEYVNAYRERQKAAGGGVLYVNLSGEATEALETIMQHKLCDKRQAAENALIRVARDIMRKR